MFQPDSLASVLPLICNPSFIGLEIKRSCIRQMDWPAYDYERASCVQHKNDPMNNDSQSVGQLECSL